jgi:cytoskeleton protein RodZ
MANDMHPLHHEDVKTSSFGSQLKTAREALGLSQQSAATQLRLTEKVVAMLEAETYGNTIPVTFLRGYIRSYGRLLHISENEIQKALDKIHPDAANSHPVLVVKEIPVTSSNYYMQAFTFIVVITLVGLVGIWWYTHPTLQLTLPNVTETPTASTPLPSPVVTTPPAPPIHEESRELSPGLVPAQAISTLPPVVVKLDPNAAQEAPVANPPPSGNALMNAQPVLNQPAPNQPQPAVKKSTPKRAQRVITPAREEDSSPYYDDATDFETNE